MPRIPPASRSSSSTRIRSIALLRRGGAGLGQQEPELVAAHPAGEIVDAGLLGDQAADGDQHRVAGRVAVLEVQMAKPVDVEQGHRQRALVAVGARDVELELGSEGAEAEQARDQRIPLGEPGQLLFELADPLPSSRELLGQALSIPRSAPQADLSARSWRVLENRLAETVPGGREG